MWEQSTVKQICTASTGIAGKSNHAIRFSVTAVKILATPASASWCFTINDPSSFWVVSLLAFRRSVQQSLPSSNIMIPSIPSARIMVVTQASSAMKVSFQLRWYKTDECQSIGIFYNIWASFTILAIFVAKRLLSNRLAFR